MKYNVHLLHYYKQFRTSKLSNPNKNIISMNKNQIILQHLFKCRYICKFQIKKINETFFSLRSKSSSNEVRSVNAVKH